LDSPVNYYEHHFSTSNFRTIQMSLFQIMRPACRKEPGHRLEKLAASGAGTLVVDEASAEGPS